MHRASRIGAVGALSLVMVGCGGGGGGGGNSVCVTGALHASTVTDATGNYATTAPDAGAVPQAVTGLVRYERVGHNATTHALDYGSIATLPVRGATVEVRTQGGQSRVCVRAESVRTAAAPADPSWDIQVRDNTAGNALYVMQSASFTPTGATTVDLTAATGWNGTRYDAPRVSAPFAILDSMYDAVQKAITADSAVDFPALEVYWSVNNTNASGNPALGQIGTSHYQNDAIYILGDANNDTDEFDDHVIIHEFGHFLEDNLSRSDSLGGPHGSGDLLDLRLAYGEGFGNAWSGIVTDDPVYQDSFGNAQGQGFDINVETDTLTGSLLGWFSETSTAAIIYDLYDATNEGGASGDAITLPFATLWDVWVGAQKTTPALTSIHSFLDGVRDNNAGSVAAIDALAAAMDVNSSDEWGTGETDDGGLAFTLPVHASYTIGQGATQYCTSNANGEYVGHGARRFLRLDVGSTGVRTFSVTNPSNQDPDAVLHLAGVAVVTSEAVGNEAFIANLAVGSYVLEVYPYTNVDGDPATGGTNVCVTVTVQ